MGVAIISVRSFKELMITVIYFWAVAGLYLCDSIVRLHHTLFGPVDSRRSLAEHVLSFSIEMSDSSECSDIVEAYLMLNGVGMSHDMSKKFHSLLGEAL